jgi:hypothetical protein
VIKILSRIFAIMVCAKINSFAQTAVQLGDLEVFVVRGEIVTISNHCHRAERTNPTRSRLRALAFGGRTLVVVGDEGSIASSVDGITWKSERSNTDERLRAIIYEQGQFVAVGLGGCIVTSKNGSTWRKRKSGVTGRLVGVAYGNGAFMAVGLNGSVLTSGNGRTWIRQPNLPQPLSSLTFTNGLFTACDAQSQIFQSVCGRSWVSGQLAKN